MSLLNFLTNRKTASHPAKINLRNALAVVQAWFRKKKRVIGGFELPDHIYEQIIWRRVEVQRHSPMCWAKGSCKVCGCDILGKTMEDRGCSIAEHPELLEKRKPCYPDMMDADGWQVYKSNNKINLFD